MKQSSAILSWLLSAAMAAAAGYGVGVANMQAEQAKQVSDAAQTAQQAANTEATYSAQTSAHVDATAAASTSNINNIKDALVGHLEQTQPKVVYRDRIVYRDRAPSNDQGSEPNSSAIQHGDVEAGDSVRPWTFDRGTVGMLNAARLGLSADAASFSDGAGSAPSTVGVPEFVSNDLQVVARYQSLKIKHDALVDYLERLKAQGYGLCVAPEIDYSQTTLDDP